MTVAGALLVWLLAATGLVVWRHGATLQALWSEPVLRGPVLIFESDDWGPGDPTHAQRLRRLADTLNDYKDAYGHPPVMTLGLVLAIADGRQMRECSHDYAAVTLADARFAAIREAIEYGVRCGVFALQLHGKEHYWPRSLMEAAKTDKAVAAWLGTEYPATEGLSPALQSRWIDASALPSRALEDNDIEAAVKDEVALFEHIFGCKANVVVPPTFVWTSAVEHAWAKHGIHVLVTPGQRFERRDNQGKVVAGDVIIRNGMLSRHPLIYVVRDDYFEPAKGHRAEHAVAALELKTKCGRPALLETHRFNYVGDPSLAERAYTELQRAIEGALRSCPQLRFASTEVLAHALRTQHADWIDPRWSCRFQAWCWRLRQEAQLWRLARFTGLAWVVLALQRVAATLPIIKAA